MDLAFYVTTFVTLFVIIDPIGTTPLFVALTQGSSAQERRKIGTRAICIGFGLLTLFAFLGEQVLGFAGISMSAFRIAGGILLFLTALQMLFEKRNKRREDQASEQPAEDPSVFPLATPLIAGPGSITTVILLTGDANGDLFATFAILGMVLLVLVSLFILFLSAGLLERVLGQTGINVITRLLGMLLAALAVQFVLDGLRDFGLAPL